MGKHDARGRSKGEAQHVRLYAWLLDSPAYESLRPGARALLVELYRLYKGHNNGQLFMSTRDAARKLHWSDHHTASRYFAELIDRGFIRPNRVGSFSQKVNSATTWELTQYGVGDKPPSMAFQAWGRKKRGGENDPMVG